MNNRNIDNKIRTTLKHNVVLAINTQEELNLLSSLEDGVLEDCIYVNEPYVAFKDNDNAIQLLPMREIDDSYPMEFNKPKKFHNWFKKNK